MKKKLMSNLFLKIVSVIAAFLFWLVIINITDPTTSRTFQDIPVEILNENVITSANQVYEVEDGDTVQVTVKGKRSFVETLTEKDFTATADLSELSKVNAVNINVRLNKESSSSVEVDWGNAVMKVNLEKRVTKKFKVEVYSQGDLSDSYVLGEMVAKPNILEVSGGESKLKKIDHVGVMVTLNGESEDFESEYSPILYDDNGDVVDSGNVTFSKDSIKVSTEVLETKEVPIYVTATGTPAQGYRLAQTDFKPETVQVYGAKDALARTTSIKISVSIEGVRKDVEKEIELGGYLPSGLKLVGDTSTLSVRCEIERDGQRVMSLTASDIAVKNLPQNYTMNFESDTKKYAVNVLGEESVLSDVAVADLGAYIELGGLSAGTHSLEVKFNLPTGVRVKNKIKVKVTLTDQNSAQETAQPTKESDTGE